MSSSHNESGSTDGDVPPSTGKFASTIRNAIECLKKSGQHPNYHNVDAFMQKHYRKLTQASPNSVKTSIYRELAKRQFVLSDNPFVGETRISPSDTLDIADAVAQLKEIIRILGCDQVEKLIHVLKS
jgi:hypothetical protein